MSDHYFTTPTDEEHRRTITARIGERVFTFTTANQVFSRDRLDLATSVLLRSATPSPEATRICDLGCGWGPIAVWLAHESDAHIDAVDVNERALALCADNAASNGVGDRVTALRPADVDPQARYDEIWSNPPIRIGKEALHDLLSDWLPRLVPTGVAHLVVGKNLGADSLQKWLIAQGWRAERIASAKGFRVMTVRPPL